MNRSGYILLKAIIFPSIFGLISCVDNIQQEQSIDRVVLVYLASDNSLSIEGYQKLEALSLWAGKPGCKLLVYLDALDATPRLIELSGKGERKIIKTYPELNSAEVETFRQILSDVQTSYPSSSYGLVLFSHASGWLPEGALLSPHSAPVKLRSVAVDGQTEMELIKLTAAIPDNSFDFIVFEACFMSGIEVAYQLKDKTDYILASSAEILSPGFTPVYSSAISQLFEGPTGLEGFGKAAFAYWDTQSGSYRSMTLSLIRTDGLQPLAHFIGENANTTKQITLTDIQHFDRYASYRLFFDFEDYYSQLLDPVKQDRLSQLVNECIVWKASTSDFMIGYNGIKIDKHSGMTLYIPQESFPALNTTYKELEWYKATHVSSLHN